MPPLSFQSFDQLYQAAARLVLQHWTTEMQREIATHCYGWSPGRFDFRVYLEASSTRFYRAYRAFAALGKDITVCDVGSHWGVFPITLKRLGYEVTMTESLQYYGDSFNGLFKTIAESGVTIIDFDPFATGASLAGSFDVVMAMAVLEHYPHSLKIFMEHIKAILKAEGRLYLEVPNIAYWPKRLLLLLGRSPLAPLADVYRSEIPFIGHHHEFTMSELRDLARLSGLSVLAEDCYNYAPESLPGVKMLLRSPVQLLAYALLKESRECLAVLCKRSAK